MIKMVYSASRIVWFIIFGRFAITNTVSVVIVIKKYAIKKESNQKGKIICFYKSDDFFHSLVLILRPYSPHRLFSKLLSK